MIQDLKYLIQLQEIDLRIKEQEDAKEKYPAAVTALEDKIVLALKSKNAVAAKLEKIANSIKELDEQTAKMRDGLAKSEEKLTAIQNNREYDAVHAEIEAQKGILNASQGKRDALEIDAEKCKSSLANAEAEYERIVSELTPQIEELKSKISAIDENIAHIQKERDEVSPKVGQYIIRTYDSIRKKRKSGKAVSLVCNSTKACSICYMILRPQLFSEVRRGNDFILCESCGAMLVWNEV